MRLLQFGGTRAAADVFELLIEREPRRRKTNKLRWCTRAMRFTDYLGTRRSLSKSACVNKDVSLFISSWYWREKKRKDRTIQGSYAVYPHHRLWFPNVFISSYHSPSRGNCLSQKFIFSCLHSESRHQNIQLTQGLCVYTGILMQLITTESTEQKAKDIIIFTTTEGSSALASERNLFLNTRTWIIHRHLKYFQVQTPWLEHTPLKANSASFHLRPRSRTSYWDIHCVPGPGFIDKCERCGTLKRHRMVAGISSWFSKDADAININNNKIKQERMSMWVSINLFPLLIVSSWMAVLLRSLLPPLLLLKQSN